jgi:Coenzyme PQQ synthesis protein D (PqqD)
MDRDSRPCRSEAVLSNSAGDAVILLHSETGEYFSLDEVGGRIWELADGTRTLDDITRALLDEFDAPRETIDTDARSLLRELARERLLDDPAYTA